MRLEAKKILVTLVILSFIIPTAGISIEGKKDTVMGKQGDFIDIETARIVAFNKLISLGEQDTIAISQVDTIMGHDEIVLCYLCSVQTGGYIAISAYTCLPPVIAYSLEDCSMVHASVYNPLVTLLKTDLQMRFDSFHMVPQEIIEEYKSSWKELIRDVPPRDMASDFQQWPPRGTTSTGGWLETNWHQEAPYNNFCPFDNQDDARSVAGCPAVTMAQILNYHQDAKGIQFNDTDDYHHNYGGNRYVIDDDSEEFDFPSFPELDRYLRTLTSHYQDQVSLTDDDKAALVFACGVAAEQVYTSEGSGTFGVNQAYEAYLRFGIENIDLLTDQDTDLFGRMRMNIVDGLPAHLAVVIPDWSGGHNLVVDGYNTDDYYHLNFGWGGSGNGWYLLPDEIPYDLTVIEGVIIDIMNRYSGSDIYCDGVLRWIDVPPGEVVTGTFTVQNRGENGSLLDWKIIEYPEWGTWTFTPSNGKDLSPPDAPVTVEFSVVSPEKKIRKNTGYIKVDNQGVTDDFFILPIHLATTHYKINDSSLMIQFLMRLLDLFPGLQTLIPYHR